ncbi:hypothetical protein GCM10017673_11250 [Streptosporangium violaceochromogenes]|nr:hypothetical protein GCM10017673_11250 [Streptosporangium violaceochromogenes]
MRRIIIATVAAVFAAGTVACGLGPAETAPRPTDQPAGQVYVLNLHGTEEGRADRRPANLVLSEFSTVRGVTWTRWGPRNATGTGELSGTWCLPRCQERPYTATITLGGVKKVKGRSYFTTFSVDGDFTKPAETADTLTGTLPTP